MLQLLLLSFLFSLVLSPGENGETEEEKMLMPSSIPAQRNVRQKRKGERRNEACYLSTDEYEIIFAMIERTTYIRLRAGLYLLLIHWKLEIYAKTVVESIEGNR